MGKARDTKVLDIRDMGEHRLGSMSCMGTMQCDVASDIRCVGLVRDMAGNRRPRKDAVRSRGCDDVGCSIKTVGIC